MGRYRQYILSIVLPIPYPISQRHVRPQSHVLFIHNRPAFEYGHIPQQRYCDSLPLHWLSEATTGHRASRRRRESAMGKGRPPRRNTKQRAFVGGCSSRYKCATGLASARIIARSAHVIVANVWGCIAGMWDIL